MSDRIYIELDRLKDVLETHCEPSETRAVLDMLGRQALASETKPEDAGYDPDGCKAEAEDRGEEWDGQG